MIGGTLGFAFALVMRWLCVLHLIGVVCCSFFSASLQNRPRRHNFMPSLLRLSMAVTHSRHLAGLPSVTVPDRQEYENDYDALLYMFLNAEDVNVPES